MGGMRASLSPLDSAPPPCSRASPSFGILCVGIDRVVGVTARSPLACQRPSKPAPKLIPIFQWAPRRSHRGLTVLDARDVNFATFGKNWAKFSMPCFARKLSRECSDSLGIIQTFTPRPLILMHPILKFLPVLGAAMLEGGQLRFNRRDVSCSR